MIRIPEDDFNEDSKAPPQMEKLLHKDLASKPRYHLPASPEDCSDTLKNNCFPKGVFINNSLNYPTHIIKSGSPASSIEESVYPPEFGNQVQLTHGQQINTMPPSGDMNFYSFPDFISDQEKTILSDAEKLLRSKENDLYGNEYNHIHDVFAVRKYYHPLFAHGICRWPGCEMDLEDIASFVK